METIFWIWMAAALIFLIIELVTPAFLFACFSVGAFASGLFSIFSPEAYYWQIGIFVVVSLVLLPFTRKLADKISKEPPELSNVDRMIGQAAVVTKVIDPVTGGQIQYEGELWQARAEVEIEQGAKVQIVSVTGTQAHVERLSD